jgi:hypothetical protein
MKIFLVWVSCEGKATIGKRLANRLGFQFFDFDEEVEKYFTMPFLKGQYRLRQLLSSPVDRKGPLTENPQAVSVLATLIARGDLGSSKCANA